MISHLSYVMTLANSVIGVSVLAMPYCFKQCGVILSILVLLTCCGLSRLASHFLIKSAVMSRRRNYEFLAFHAFGYTGKFLVELFVIGFLLGTCIAFFVVVGDLGPQILGKVINKSPDNIRTSFLVTTGLLIVLPLGLFRNIDSFSSVSIATVGFYACLVIKVMAESMHHIFLGDWYEHITFWRPAGIPQCLPIFSMALSCQTQLFEIYETIPNVSLEKMNQIVRGALNLCTLVYISMGLFGYIAFCAQYFTGNILMSFEPSLSSEVIKMGFVVSVAFSFPLIIFPCRASLNSLLYRRVYSHLETSATYIPEIRFRCLTFAIVMVSMIIGILIPNIEYVLGLLGSTVGVTICLIFPAAFFMSISSKNTNERLLAQLILFAGIWIIVLGTYTNLYAIEESSQSQMAATAMIGRPIVTHTKELKLNLVPIIDPVKDKLQVLKDIKGPPAEAIEEKIVKSDARKEPPIPVPVEPVVSIDKKSSSAPLSKGAIVEKPLIDDSKTDLKKTVAESNEKDLVAPVLSKNKETEVAVENKVEGKSPDKQISGLTAEEKIKAIEEKQGASEDLQVNQINVDALKKEDTEIAADNSVWKAEPNDVAEQQRDILKKTLKKHELEQKEMLREQKEILKTIKEQKKELEQEMMRKIENSKTVKASEQKAVGIGSEHNENTMLLEDKENLDNAVNNLETVAKQKESGDLKDGQEPLIVVQKIDESQSAEYKSVEHNIVNSSLIIRSLNDSGRGGVEKQSANQSNSKAKYLLPIPLKNVKDNNNMMKTGEASKRKDNKNSTNDAKDIKDTL